MEKSLHKFKFLAVLFLLLSLSSIEGAYAQKTWDAGAGTTNWGDGANWAPNGVPTAGQTVTIANGLTINVNVAAVCSSLTISGGANDTTVTITGTNSLTTGAVSIGAGTGNGDDQILAVGAGSLNCTSIAITATGNANRISAVTISSGTVTCSGNITLNDANDDITFTGGGLLRVGGNMSGGTFTRSTGTVEYYGDGTGGTLANQSIAPYTYYNLVTSGSGTKSLTANTVINGGSVNVQSGTTLDLLAFTLNRSASGGTLTVAGSLWLGGTTGGQTGSNFPTNFATLALTSGTVSYDATTGGQTIFATPAYGTLALDNTSGTQTAGGNITATTVNNNIGGTLNMGANTLSLTNVTNAGIIRTQNTSASPIPAGKTWGGTVQFDGAGQSVPGSGTTFNNLIYAGSGTKTLTGGAMTISSDFTVNSGVVANLGTFTSSADRLYLGGNGQNSGSHGGTGSGATFINTTYFSATSGRINVATAACTAGTWLGGVSTDWNNAANWCGSVPTASTNVIIPSGAAFQPSIGASGGVCNNITINSGATLTISSTNSLTVSGNWTNNGTFTANSSTVAFNGTTQSVSGTTTFSSLSVTNGTTTAGAALTVSGVLTVASGATLDMSTFALSGAALTTSGTGTLRTQAAGATPLPTGRTWSQNVEYYGASAQTILAGTYSGNLTLSGARGANALTIAGALNVGGNLGITATSSATIGLNFNSAGNVRVFNIGGDYIQSSTINVEFGSAGSGTTTTVNLTGSFSKTAGYMTTSVADNAVFNFVGTNQNIQSNGGTQIKWINFNIANGSTCTLNGAFNFEGTSGNPGLFTVNSGGTLVCGTNVLGGTPNTTFTLANGGNLEIGSSAGITTAGTATGNIQTVIRTFGTGANYIYNGGGAQAAGTGLPATVGSLAVVNNTTLTLPSAKAITNNFSIASGSVANLGTFTHTAGTLTMGSFGSPNGTHGSTTSAATYKNNTFFAATTGIVNVGTGTCAAFTAAISGTAAICNGGSTNLSVAITGGLPNYTVVSSAGTVNNYTSGNPVSVSPGTTTNYTLTSVRDNNGCPATTSGTATVTVNAVPAAGTLTPTPAAGTICSGGTVSATASAGTGGAETIVDELEYSLNGGAFTAYTSGTAINTTGQTSISIRTRRTATGSGCTTSGYNTVSWTINAAPVSGTLTPNVAAGAICAGQSVSATATAGSGGAGTIVDELERSLSGGAYAAYTSGTAINTTGQTSVSIRTRRTATGSGCTSSAYNTVTWTVNAVPAAGTLTPSPAAGAICSGGTVSATASAGSGGAGTIVDELQVSLSGGSYTAYTSGTAINTAGQTSISIRTRRTATGSGCTASGYNTVSWTINAAPASGTLTPSPAPGTICAGGTVSATATAGSGGAGTIVDELQVSLSGGSYTAYTSGTAINTAGQTSVSIRTRRTATGSGCTSSAYNTVAWTINASPTASIISGSAAICSGSTSNIQVAVTGGASPYNVVYSGGTVGSYVSGSNIPVAPTSTTTYTLLSVTDANGCAGTGNSGSAVLTIDSTTSVNGGPWSNGAPGAGKSVIFDNTNVTLGADFDACSLTLKNNSVVNIQSGADVLLSGALTIETGSTFTLNNNANLLQTIPAGTSYSNSGNAIVKRNSSALKRLDYTLWSSPVTGQGVYAFSKLTLGNRFYVYRTNTNVYNNADLGFNLTGLDANGVNGTDSNNVQFAPAKGYLIRMPWNHPTAPAVWNGSYTGVPNNGNITFTMTNGGAGQRFNLVGNPYPSPIDMTQFVADNSGRITGTLYFWRETNLNTSNNAYCSWAGGTFTTNGEAQVFDPNGLIRTGQGFFVEASGAATTVDFRNGQRSTDNSNQFFKNNNVANDAAETNRFWLNLTNASGGFSQMAAGYMTNATNGVDIYDGKNINEGNVLLNSILDNEDYTIQGKSLPFSASDMIPLSYKVGTAGSYTIAIDHVDGLFSGGTQPIYIKDNLLNTEHDLQTGAYSFASDSGTFNNRFEIVYQPRLSVPVFTPNTVVVYTENNGFVVNSGNAVMDSIKVFDIRGRLLQEKKDINANQATITGGIANQVLLLQITSEDGAVVTKKVIK